MRRIYHIAAIPIVLLIIGCVLPAGMVEAEPAASFTYYPKDPEVDENITFDASRSYGDDLRYIWEFGDGGKAEGMIVNHSFSEAGDYTVILVVVDADNETSTKFQVIHVTEPISEAAVFFILTFYVIILGLYLLVFLLIGAILIFYPLNLVIGGIFAYKTYKKGRDLDMMSEATPYLVAFLISGAVSLFNAYFAPISVIAHLVIYHLFNKRLREISGKPVKRKKKKKKKASKK